MDPGIFILEHQGIHTPPSEISLLHVPPLNLVRRLWYLLEPPTNVTLHCHNLHNVLKWNYDKLVPEMIFKVYVRSWNGKLDMLLVEPPAELQADLSPYSDPRNIYSVSVTAGIGRNESDFAPSENIEFSYFENAPFMSKSAQKCFLDFPLVNVTVLKAGTVRLRFTHPWLWYNPGYDTEMEDLPLFRYSVSLIDEKEHPHSTQCEESVCEQELLVDAAQKKHCLTISGSVKKISVRNQLQLCTVPFEEPSSLDLVHGCVVGILLTLSAAAFVLFMVYRKKTNAAIAIPDFLTFTDPMKPDIQRDLKETIYEPEVTSRSPSQLDEEEDIKLVIPFSDEPGERMRLGVSAEGEGISDSVEVTNEEGSGYTHGRDLEADELLDSNQGISGYEKRPVLVSLVPGEPAEGYCA
ncbi:interferon gamma receptor 1-like isoform X1 [Eleginops maclovinus]|uniref:interferon gamma receptor 1-like isoform X1 n=1 Tax=Eleginops maclovinus TaxID=56733 RepID=UPI00308071E4